MNDELTQPISSRSVAAKLKEFNDAKKADFYAGLNHACERLACHIERTGEDLRGYDRVALLEIVTR